MSFPQLFEVVSAWLVANLPTVIGVGVAAAVLTVMFFTNRRRGLDPAKLLGTNTHSPLTEEKAANWAPPEQSYADRRGAVRRDGPPVRVLLAATTFRNGATDGFVIDRSTGGMKLALGTAIAPGSTMQARAANAPDTIGFITLIVRSCRRNGDFYEVGCEFEQTPPWNVLLLFG